jgi:predicted DNA-binding ribbon-helix-helix protein
LSINKIARRLPQRVIPIHCEPRQQPGSLPQFLAILADWADYFKRSVVSAAAGGCTLATYGGRDNRNAMNGSGVVKRSVRIAGHATSVSLEAAFWQALAEIARRRALSVAALVAVIDVERGGSLSSAIRLFVLDSARRGELGGEVSEGGG